MNEEMKSMAKNQVWYLVMLAKGVVAIGCKWVFKTFSPILKKLF